MDLREYLYREDMTVTKLAEIVDCNKSYLSCVKKKRKKPGKKLAKYIERATEGKVTADYLLNGVMYKENEMLSKK